MNITSIIRPFFMRRIRHLQSVVRHLESTQRTELARLIHSARDTEWGRKHRYGSLADYNDYRDAVAVTDYEQIRPLVMRMIAGERDILWKGVTRRFAQSSGTSDGCSKFIPVTDDSLTRCHYRGGADVVAHYLDMYPESRIFSGRSFILGGSFDNTLHDTPPHVKVGDLSANLIDAINPLAELVRIPSRKIALMPDWCEKLPALVNAARHCNVTNISGVPSWFLTVLRETLKSTGATHIHDVWPNLEVFFHGGISFTPYRKQYDAIIDPARMRYLETYNASEGFFAVQDTPDNKAMLLLTDAGIFYEFIPIDRPDAQPVPAWEVEQGGIYAMIISSCNGLWRYQIGDTVKIENTEPLRITVAGRTKHYINAFGEEVMIHNTDAAIAKACRESDCDVLNYTVAPVYTDGELHGHHQWLIEFNRAPADIEMFADTLDRLLTEENSDYKAKRAGSIFLDRLSIIEARHGLFDDWLASTGKLGGQRKIPRLCNDRHIIESMLKFNK